jgi:hypothetical protein
MRTGTVCKKKIPIKKKDSDKRKIQIIERFGQKKNSDKGKFWIKERLRTIQKKERFR